MLAAVSSVWVNSTLDYEMKEKNTTNVLELLFLKHLVRHTHRGICSLSPPSKSLSPRSPLCLHVQYQSLSSRPERSSQCLTTHPASTPVQQSQHNRSAILIPAGCCLLSANSYISFLDSQLNSVNIRRVFCVRFTFMFCSTQIGFLLPIWHLGCQMRTYANALLPKTNIE